MCKPKHILLIAWLSSLVLLVSANCFAGIENNHRGLNGPFSAGANYTTADTMFTNPNWSTFTNNSVKSTVALRVLDNVLISAAFTYTANIQVQYYTSPTASVTTVNTSLTVNYVPGQGAKYKGLDVYNVPGAYKVIVTVNSTSVTGTAPASSVQLTTDIVIDRTYPFVPASNMSAAYGKLSRGRQLKVSWPAIAGADEYDIEWTTINNGNPNFALIAADSLASSSPAIPLLETALAQSFRNSASRLTTDSTGCTFSMLSTDNIMLVRIRQVQYNRTTGVRVAGNWDYKNNTRYAIWTLVWDEQGQNWQYSAAFAEQGKKKEVISYFDGTLRGRQTVTLNNTDNVAIAQENVYDDLGRPTASILPAPFKDTAVYPFLHYILKFNLFSSTVPYTFANIAMTGCELNPSPLSTLGGAAKYYSFSNDFKGLNNAYNYIPDAAGYPLSVTQYTADNTGRIKSQGGVGLAFQPGKSGGSLASRTTKYYYGKPEQWELDQLFANDVGYAEHYLKNMVIDPNGQISISYLNASGKTVATALSGPVPGMLDSLPSYHPVQGSKPTNTHILKPEQFIFDSSALTLTANTTYLASVIGTDTLKFNIQRLVNKYPGTFQICSNCFYRMTVNVTNDCGDAAIPPISTPIIIGDSVAACADTTLFPQNFVVSVLQPGEYNVTIRLAFDNSVIQSYADAFIKKGMDSLYIEQQFNYIKKRYLDSMDVSACYSDCHTCEVTLGSQASFVLALQTKIVSLGVDTTASLFKSWATSLYVRLKGKCDTLQSTCTYGSPCDATQALMVTDLTPGGQFALFTATGTAVEPEVNTVSTNWRTVFPVLSATDPIYIANEFTLPDGTVLSPNASSFTLANLVTYWQPTWAVMFLPYHPEYCKLQFCNSHASYKKWDQRVKQDINVASDVPLIPTGGAPLSYSSSNASDWLMNGDPFFKTGGTGIGYAAAMKSDLLSYSNNILHVPTSAGAVKGLMAYNDYLLYCQDKTGNTNTGSPIDSNWRSCIPNPACRVVDREWLAYRDAYFTLKDKYFTMLQNDTCGTSCPVGQTVNFNLPGACPGISEFSIKPYTGTPTCTGAQTVVLTHEPGSLNQLMTLIIYYPSNYDSPSLTHSLVIPSGQSQATFCIPNTIPVNVVKVQTAYCGSAPVYGNDPSYTVKFTDVLTNQLAPCSGQSHVFYSSAVITLLDGSGNPVNATTGISMAVTTTTSASCEADTHSFIISAGESSSPPFLHITYLGSDCPSICPVIFGCVEQLTNASHVSGIALCSGVTPSNPQPPVNPCPVAYTTKISRFPTTGGTAIGNISGITDGSQLTGPANTSISSQAADFCAANADTWMARLQPGLTAIGANATQIAQLRSALIGICSAGGDQIHPMGASTLPPGQTLPYVSFGAAIKSIILPVGSNFISLLNPWLIDAPYPYSPIQQSVAKVISYSNSSICSILQADSASALATHKTLYNYLADTYGSAMTLSHADLNALKNSCYNCRFIIANDIALPSIFDPQTPGCLSRTDYTSAKTSMNTQFGGTLLATDPNYQSILSNFMNQRFGFSLTYDDYNIFETGTAPQLCNTLPYSEVIPDPYDCVENAMTRAVNSGLADYESYIALQRQSFMASYVSNCKLAQANANMVAVEQDYHYTLYYYDQADNLVRTVPPEGVTLVDAGLFNYIDKARDLDTAAYTWNYNGPATASSPTGMTDLSTTLNAASGAVEMWLYNAGANHYHWVEATPAHDYLFQVGLAGNQLDIDVFPINQPGTNYVKINPKTGHYHADISALQPLLPFTHVVFQGSQLGTGNILPQLYLNGTALAVINDDSVSPPFGFTISPTTGGVIYPDSIYSLKHLRLYSHTLSQATIRADASSQFFYANDTGYLSWYRYNIPAAGAPPTTINSSTTDETAIFDTYANHVLTTTYGYNSTNQVNIQHSPDGGTSDFWYDLLSRLVISQNAKQSLTTDYSYTAYDQLGRITEAGQKNYTGTSIGTPDYLADATIGYFNAAGTNSQITDTYYDAPVPTIAGNTNGIATLPGQSNLRKRVAASTYTETQGGPALRATYYNYDIDGNVKTLWQQVDGLYQNSTNTGLKRIDYEYDLVSGKVNFVRYEDGQPDAFYYNYTYDADNRLTQAYSGINAITDTLTHSYLPLPSRKRDAAYAYYLHGPLRRMMLGNNNANVQGVDYAYTLQGWLKGVNSAYVTAATDIGQDGADLTHTTARDAYGYSLGYYTGDYSPIGGASYTAFNLKYTENVSDITGQSLYNGNISNTTLAIAQLDGTAVNGFTYHYDQLNRLKKMRRHPGITGTSWTRSSITLDYQENVTYDGNGNILTYGRNGAAPTAQTIDSLTYHYSRAAAARLNSNKLQYITDAVTSSLYTGDITNQNNTTNYRYDAIGNLIYDAQSGITGNDGVNSITWSVYGKIQNIYKTAGTISYTYNPAGQRVSKTAAGLTTWYIRDAQGNPLAVYDNAHGNLNWKEQQLYGSSRLGMWTPNVNLTTNNAVAAWDTIGGKQYELDNHLGNVLATVTDKRLQHTTNTTSIDYYLADVSTAQDYYPFGMLMPGRQSSTANYRYGFNGKENDNEVKGVGNQIDYGERIYDPRGSRFLSVDPLTGKFAWYSPYQFAGNNPISFIDLDGEEPQIPSINKFKYGDNVALNAITVVDNSAINLINGGTGLINSFIGLGNELIFNTKRVPNEFASAGKDLYHSSTLYAKNTYKYWTTTSGKQMLKETKDAFSDPETYESTLTLGASLYTGRKAPGLSTSEQAASYSVFEQSQFQRGLDIEELLGGNLPKNFPVIDRFADGVATSIKSIDLTSKTYQNTSNLMSKLKGYVNSVSNFRGATFDRRTITNGEILSRELNVAIQEGKATAQQLKVFDEIKQYGIKNNVSVKITTVK